MRTPARVARIVPVFLGLVAMLRSAEEEPRTIDGTRRSEWEARLRSDDAALRRRALSFAMDAPEPFRSEAMLDGLLEILRSNPSAEDRFRAIRALGRFDRFPEKVAPALIESLAGAAEDLRIDILHSLAAARGAPRLLLPLLPLLDGPPGKVRDAAISTLRLGGKGMVEVLLPSLVDADPAVRRRAAEAIGGAKFWTDASFRALLAGIGDPDAPVRIACIGAIDSLSSIYRESCAGAVGPLLDAAGDPDDGVREAALRAIRGVRRGATGAILGAADRLRPCLAHPSAGIRIEGAETAGILGVSSADLAADLERLLDDPDAGARAAAAAALGRLGARDRAGRIAPMLGDPSPEARLAASIALIQLEAEIERGPPGPRRRSALNGGRAAAGAAGGASRRRRKAPLGPDHPAPQRDGRGGARTDRPWRGPPPSPPGPP